MPGAQKRGKRRPRRARLLPIGTIGILRAMVDRANLPAMQKSRRVLRRLCLAASLGTILFTGGCIACHVTAERIGPKGVQVTETRKCDYVQIPLFPSSRVRLYWTDGTDPRPSRAPMPAGEYVVVGLVSVATLQLFGEPAIPQVEWQLRRAATGLHADAVLADVVDEVGSSVCVEGLAVKWGRDDERVLDAAATASQPVR